MATERISVPDGASVVLRLAGASASLTVLAGASDDVEVDAARARTTVTPPSAEGEALQVQVSTKSAPVTIRCPTGIDIVLAVASGRAELRGRCGAVRVTARSADVRAESVASLDARSGSGDIAVGACEGECRVLSRNGTIEVDSAHDLHAVTKSGTLAVGTTTRATVSSGSGRIDLGVAGTGPIRIRSMTGAATISVPAGRLPDVSFRTRSGSLRNDVGDGDDFDLTIRTMSGSMTVRPR